MQEEKRAFVNGLADSAKNHIGLAKLATSEEERAETVRNIDAAYQRVVDNPSEAISAATGGAESYVRETSSAQMAEDGLRSTVANVLSGGPVLKRLKGLIDGAKGLARGGKSAVSAVSSESGAKGAGGAVDDVGVVRPTPKQSEIDVGVDLAQGARPQVSYKNGQEVPYGTSGSVRPGWCIGNVCGVEVKNYNIATNQQGLIRNVSKQALQRAENLPQGMQQQVIIDIRGQAVTDAQKNAVIKGIVQKSNGALGPTDIRFKAE